MSNQSERPWTEEEKYTLLTEILKKAGIPSGHLVKIIKDFRINPSWTEIPLPQGRPLSSCQAAFWTMWHHHPQPPMPMQTVPISLPPPRHEPSVPPAPPVESRKRPHYPDKPILAPRAIQPRPSTASYSSESGASAHLSPGLESVTSRGERPRKRGRPSKAETERRKAVAEARGEMYPPPRRPGAKPKIPSAPTSPVAVESRGVSFSPRTSVQIPEASRHDPRYVPPPPGRAIASLPLSGEDRSREIPDRESGPIFRELPRPTQTLPSPQALHLGPREPIPRIDLGDRRFEPLPPDRAPLTMNRPRAMTDHPRRPDQPPISMPEATMSTPIEKRPG